VLKVGPETLLLESSPQNELMHSTGMLAPLRELFRIQGKLLLQFGDVLGLLIEQDGAITGLETAESLLRSCPCLRWCHGFDRWLDNFLPELRVLGAQKDDHACGLRVERAGHVSDGLVHDFVDLGVGDW